MFCIWNSSFEEHIPYDLIVAYLWLPLGNWPCKGVCEECHGLAAIFEETNTAEQLDAWLTFQLTPLDGSVMLDR